MIEKLKSLYSIVKIADGYLYGKNFDGYIEFNEKTLIPEYIEIKFIVQDFYYKKLEIYSIILEI